MHEDSCCKIGGNLYGLFADYSYVEKCRRTEHCDQARNKACVGCAEVHKGQGAPAIDMHLILNIDYYLLSL